MQTILAAAAIWLTAAQSCGAAELLMYRQPGCPYCLTWDRMVGPAYPKSDLGKQVPVRMVDLKQPDQPRVELAGRVIYTPTFVLVDGGREVGRIEGYPGEDFFWARLEKLVRSLPVR